MKPYPAYRDSAVPWLGSMPAHWRVLRTKYILGEVDDRSKTGEETQLSMTQTHGLVESSKIDTWRMRSESYAGGKLCQEDDLVLNRLKAHLGVFSRAPIAGVVSPDYSVFRRCTEGSTRYFEYVLKTPDCVAELRRQTKGIVEGFWRLYTDDFYNIRVPAPPPDEQRRIADYLDAHGRLVQRFIRNRRRLIEVLNEQKQAIIDRLVTRGLDSSVRLKPSGIDRLGELPQHWESKRLKFLVKNTNEQTGSKLPDEAYIALENVESWTGCVSLPNDGVAFDSQVKRFQANDILFGKLRPYLAKVTRPQFAGVCPCGTADPTAGDCTEVT